MMHNHSVYRNDRMIDAFSKMLSKQSADYTLGIDLKWKSKVAEDANFIHVHEKIQHDAKQNNSLHIKWVFEQL